MKRSKGESVARPFQMRTVNGMYRKARGNEPRAVGEVGCRPVYSYEIVSVPVALYFRDLLVVCIVTAFDGIM
jgi:hypothetical protein